MSTRDLVDVARRCSTQDDLVLLFGRMMRENYIDLLCGKLKIKSGSYAVVLTQRGPLRAGGRVEERVLIGVFATHEEAKKTARKTASRYTTQAHVELIAWLDLDQATKAKYLNIKQAEQEDPDGLAGLALRLGLQPPKQFAEQFPEGARQTGKTYFMLMCALQYVLKSPDVSAAIMGHTGPYARKLAEDMNFWHRKLTGSTNKRAYGFASEYALAGFSRGRIDVKAFYDHHVLDVGLPRSMPRQQGADDQVVRGYTPVSSMWGDNL